MAVTKDDRSSIMDALRLILATVSAAVPAASAASSSRAPSAPTFTPVQLPPNYEKTILGWGRYKDQQPGATSMSYRTWVLQHVKNDSSVPFLRFATWVFQKHDLINNRLIDRASGREMTDTPSRSTMQMSPSPSTPTPRTRTLPRFAADADLEFDEEEDDAQTGAGRALEALTVLTIVSDDSLRACAARLMAAPPSGQTTRMAQILEATWQLRQQ